MDWKVLTELPNTANFEAAISFVTEEHMAGTFACGPDAEQHLAVAQQFVNAGFDHLALVNAGPEPDGFFDFFTNRTRRSCTTLASLSGS